MLPLVESFRLGSVHRLQVRVHHFGLDSLLLLAVGLLDVPDLIWVVGFVQQLLLSLSFPFGLLHPEGPVLSLDTFFLFAGSNDGLLVIVQLILMLSAAINHLILQSLVVVVSLYTCLIGSKAHNVGVSHHLESGLGEVRRTGLQTGHVAVRV